MKILLTGIVCLVALCNTTGIYAQADTAKTLTLKVTNLHCNRHVHHCFSHLGYQPGADRENHRDNTGLRRQGRNSLPGEEGAHQEKGTLMRTLVIVLASLYAAACSAQSVKGKIFGEQGGNKEILPGAIVRWIGTTEAAIANESGVFELSGGGTGDRRIVASITGFVTDTITPGEKTYLSIVLQADSKTLDEVLIRDRSGAYISSLSVVLGTIFNKRSRIKL